MSVAAHLTKIVRHSAVYGVADFTGKAIGFVLVPLYTRTLTQEAFGQLQIALLFLTFGVMTLGVGQVGTLLRYHTRAESEAERRQVASAVTAIVGAACLSFGALLPLLAPSAARVFLGDREAAFLFEITAIAVVARALSDVPLTLLRLEERSGFYGVGSIVRLTVSLGLIVYLVVGRGLGVRGVLLGEAAGAAVLLLVLLPFWARRLGSPRGAPWREYLGFGWPYLLANLGSFGLVAIDRLFLAGSGRIVETGIYSLGGKIANLISVALLAPFTLVWGPMSFRIARENPEDEARRIYARLLTYFAFALFVAAAGLVLFAPEILRVAGPPEYAGAVRVVPFLVASMVLYGLYRHFQVGLAVTGRPRGLAGSFLAAAGANLGLNALWIPRWGMLGAAGATLVSYFLMCGTVLLLARRVYPIDYEWGRLARGALLTIVVTSAASWGGALPGAVSFVLRALLLVALPALLLASLPAGERRSARSWLSGLRRGM